MLWVQFAAVKLDWGAEPKQHGLDRTLPLRRRRRHAGVMQGVCHRRYLVVQQPRSGVSTVMKLSLILFRVRSFFSSARALLFCLKSNVRFETVQAIFEGIW